MSLKEAQQLATVTSHMRESWAGLLRLPMSRVGAFNVIALLPPKTGMEVGGGIADASC